MDAYQQGFEADSVLSNPHWITYPSPSKLGADDEIAARRFVDGYVAALQQARATEPK